MPQFMRGAIPTPKHKLLSAIPHVALVAPPSQFAVVPPKLNMEGNDQYGDCVSAEEAWAKAWWSVYCGLSELLPAESETIAFARQYGFLNGAMLTDVMDVMKSKGMQIGGQNYKDGGYSGVDFSNETTLQSALTVGCVKIGIDANALPSGAGNQQGWYATKGGNFPNTDHCVGLGGYGSAGYLYDQLKVNLPSGLSSSTPGYILYTWATHGFVTHNWLMGTCTEAWVRNPTTVGQAPTPTPGPGPTPGPAPIPTPSPIPVGPLNLQLSMNLQPPHGVPAATYTLTSAGFPVPPELSGMGAPNIILVLLTLVLQYLGSGKYQAIIATVMADIAAGKNWGQIATDIILALLTGQANIVPKLKRAGL
jgi:hypothetical protein